MQITEKSSAAWANFQVYAKSRIEGKKYIPKTILLALKHCYGYVDLLLFILLCEFIPRKDFSEWFRLFHKTPYSLFLVLYSAVLSGQYIVFTHQ